jgi:hypothetical protein
MSGRLFRADEKAGWAEPVQITGTRRPGTDYIAHVFVFLDSITTRRLYKLTLTDQAHVTLQLGVSPSDVYKDL